MYAELWKNIKNDQKLFWYDGESEENPNPKPWILDTQPITRADAVIKTFQLYLSNTLFFIKKNFTIFAQPWLTATHSF